MSKKERERLRGILVAALDGRYAEDVFGVPEQWLLRRMALYELHEEDVRTLIRVHEECAVRISTFFRLLEEEDADFDDVAACFFAKAQLKSEHGIRLPAPLLLRARRAFDLPDHELADAMVALSERCDRSDDGRPRKLGATLQGLCMLADAGRCSTIEEGFALLPDACVEEE